MKGKVGGKRNKIFIGILGQEYMVFAFVTDLLD